VRATGPRPWITVGAQPHGELEVNMFERPKRTTCRGCSTNIVFIRTDQGRVMPIDAEPHPAGDVRIDTMTSGSLVAHVMTTEEIYQHPGRRYISHFATCPATHPKNVGAQ
jgi:hypothetical protein